MPQKQPIRITISQAANLFGVSEKTVRRALKNEELHYIVVRGVYKINFDSLLRWSQTKAKVINKFNQEGIGQYLEPDLKTSKWKIKNRLYSPNPKFAENIAKDDLSTDI
ncbi:MAG: hypothetical protein A3B89_00585 [Candidatus Buchananbacteria bacterium RIFCSPHIGHO2_02_FULL_40_13]|uniref:Helix-turn-helix domain-containing protein n=1 Tax=Candidatus Buchananbacteria bacterium RIFCSPLOWO2_01_FULL_39_33 TaxID=1797543 RepID=A0A1G1YGE2_9BACT|nr:MAG: hypothetical protein A3B89_00585 [Candidatus Buchananbacteria bacterium RIFCSPHIGHO2_02_FULL_40_13]OGY51402.1 MAG: hypothetical protein A3A02_00570 [Candidatus Buchananbacteria bacterium RIFCSPLOWO2_01_FULL_39_33]